MQTEEITFALKDERTKEIRVYCFVCTGNTCRSPMAAALLNHYGTLTRFTRALKTLPLKMTWQS